MSVQQLIDLLTGLNAPDALVHRETVNYMEEDISVPARSVEIEFAGGVKLAVIR